MLVIWTFNLLIISVFPPFTGLDVVDYSLYPDKTFQLKWLRDYLVAWHDVTGNKEAVTDKDVEALYVKTNKFALVGYCCCVCPGVEACS